MTQRRIYQNEYPYFVTFRTREGLALFEEAKYAELLAKIILNAGRLKRYDILSFQIMLDHVHMLVYKQCIDSIGHNTDRTLEKVRSVGRAKRIHHPERTLSRVRDQDKKECTISDLMQSIKGNFSLHMGNVWQRRFYTRIVDNDDYLRAVIEYIKQNPIRDGLPEKYHEMPYQCIDKNLLKLLL